MIFIINYYTRQHGQVVRAPELISRFANVQCPFLTVDAIIGDQVFRVGGRHIFFSLDLDKALGMRNQLKFVYESRKTHSPNA